MPRDDLLPPELAAIAGIVDRAAEISRAHPPGAAVDPPLARYRTALQAMREDRAAIESTLNGALITLGARSHALSREHIEASRALVASRGH